MFPTQSDFVRVWHHPYIVFFLLRYALLILAGEQVPQTMLEIYFLFLSSDKD